MDESVSDAAVLVCAGVGVQPTLDVLLPDERGASSNACYVRGGRRYLCASRGQRFCGRKDDDWQAMKWAGMTGTKVFPVCADAHRSGCQTALGGRRVRCDQ